jgi:hypothetical protein
MIVEDEFEGCAHERHPAFQAIFRDPLRKRRGHCHQLPFRPRRPHPFRQNIIFNNGRIVKKMTRWNTSGTTAARKFLMGPAASGRKPGAACRRFHRPGNAGLRCVRTAGAWGSLTTAHLLQHEVSEHCRKNTKMRESLFSLLCRRKTDTRCGTLWRGSPAN